MVSPGAAEDRPDGRGSASPSNSVTETIFPRLVLHPKHSVELGGAQRSWRETITVVPRRQTINWHRSPAGLNWRVASAVAVLALTRAAGGLNRLAYKELRSLRQSCRSSRSPTKNSYRCNQNFLLASKIVRSGRVSTTAARVEIRHGLY